MEAPPPRGGGRRRPRLLGHRGLRVPGGAAGVILVLVFQGILPRA